MRSGKLLATTFFAGLLLASTAMGAAVKPAESTSKVKKVLLWNKIGGWVHTDGKKDVTSVLTGLAKSKGFTLTTSEDEAVLTLDNLKQYQAIVWDNNTNGGASVASATARKAVVDYVNQGGGWYLIHGAGDHQNTWSDLSTALGTTFTIHGNQGKATASLDSAALKDKELKWMVEGIPKTFDLFDEWYSFQNTVRPLPGVVVIYTAGGAGTDILKAPADGSKDFTYVWAKPMGKGRMLYSAIGHGQNTLFGQVDSVVSKSLWQNVRYVAGDFQNGCMNSADAKFDAGARVDDGTCTPTSLTVGARYSSDLTLISSGHKTQYTFPHAGNYSLTVRDLRGSLVKTINIPQGMDEINLDHQDLKGGVYQLEARSGRSVAHMKVVLY